MALDICGSSTNQVHVSRVHTPSCAHSPSETCCMQHAVCIESICTIQTLSAHTVHSWVGFCIPHLHCAFRTTLAAPSGPGKAAAAAARAGQSPQRRREPAPPSLAQPKSDKKNYAETRKVRNAGPRDAQLYPPIRVCAPPSLSISSSLSRLGGAAGGRAVRCGVCVCV